MNRDSAAVRHVVATRPVWTATACAPIESDSPETLGSTFWDVAVVGGGIVGLLAADALVETGRKVCVIEARTVGGGATGAATAKITTGHGVLAAAIAERHGRRVAVDYQRANERGRELLAGIVATLPDDVGWSDCPHILYGSGAHISELRETAAIAEAAGSDVHPADPPAWAVSDAVAWTWPDSHVVNPLSLSRSLARRLKSRGVPVVEHARVEIKDSVESHVALKAAGVGFRARSVVVATHAPIHDSDHSTLRMGYFRRPVLALPLNGDDSVPCSFDPAGRSTRPVTLPDGQPGVVVVGASQRVGALTASAWAELESWSIEKLGARGSGDWLWAAQDSRSNDLLPLVTGSSERPRIVAVAGLNAWGFTNAAWIAEQLPKALEADDWQPLIGESGQWPSVRTMLTTASDGWVTARRLVQGVITSITTAEQVVAPGEGVVVGGPSKPLAVSRTRDGELHCVQARCTHLGCTVRWNSVEESWDCPCHGSRFTPDGEVLEGPAPSALRWMPAPSGM